jgi:hypothetical protein
MLKTLRLVCFLGFVGLGALGIQRDVFADGLSAGSRADCHCGFFWADCTGGDITCPLEDDVCMNICGTCGFYYGYVAQCVSYQSLLCACGF